MGVVRGSICNSCGTAFSVCEGGGFIFHELRCDGCGHETSVLFDDIGEPRLRYLEGLARQSVSVTRDGDTALDDRPGPISEEQYHRIVEGIAGRHNCGGHFRFDAPVRCPHCRSTDVRDDPGAGMVCYD